MKRKYGGVQDPITSSTKKRSATNWDNLNRRELKEWIRQLKKSGKPKDLELIKGIKELKETLNK